MPYFKLNNYDILPMIAENGLKFTYKNVQSSKGTITTMDGVDHIGRTRRKRDVEITCINLSTEYVNILFDILEDEYVSVTTDQDPKPKNPTTLTSTFDAYCESNPAECAKIYDNGAAKWGGITFTLVEA